MVWQTEDGYVSGAPVQFDGWVYFLYQQRLTSDVPNQLRRVRSGEKPAIVKVASVECANPFLSSLRILPDAKLGAIQHCVDEDSLLVSIDTASGTASRLATVSPGTDVTLASVQGRGWLQHAGKGCAAIAPIQEGKRLLSPSFQPAELLGWRIDQDFGDTSCAVSGRIGFPRYVDDQTLIVLASPESRGVDPGPLGTGRDSIGWKIYRLDTVANKVELVGGDFTNPVDVELTIDKCQVMVVGWHKGKSGIWFTDLATGSVTAVSTVPMVAASLASDGHAVLSVERSDGRDQILRLEIGRPS